MLSIRVLQNIITKYSKSQYTKLDLLNNMKHVMGDNLDVNIIKTTNSKNSKKYLDCAKIDLRGHVDRH
jgi:hypothetical protein